METQDKGSNREDRHCIVDDTRYDSTRTTDVEPDRLSSWLSSVLLAIIMLTLFSWVLAG